MSTEKMVNSEGWHQKSWHAGKKKKIEEWSWGLKGFETVGKLKTEIAGVSADLENVSLSWPPCQDWESRPATGRHALQASLTLPGISLSDPGEKVSSCAARPITIHGAVQSQEKDCGLHI